MSTKNNKLRFIDEEKTKELQKRLERIWKISSIIWNCGFCDFLCYQHYITIFYRF